MKGFRRCWVRRASLARAIIGCCEPVQADTVWRARLIRARAAEVVGPVWTRGASAVRSWLGLGPGRCGLLWVGIRACALSDARFLAACCFAVCYLAPVVCDLDFDACRALLASCAARCVWPTGAQHSSSPLYFPDRLLLCVFVEIVSRFRLFWQRIAVVNDLKEV